MKHQTNLFEWIFTQKEKLKDGSFNTCSDDPTNWSCRYDAFHDYIMICERIDLLEEKLRKLSYNWDFEYVDLKNCCLKDLKNHIRDIKSVVPMYKDSSKKKARNIAQVHCKTCFEKDRENCGSLGCRYCHYEGP